MATLPSLVQLIRSGEQVAAGVANRPLQQLDENVQYLLGLLESAAVGSTVIAPLVPVDPTVVVGAPVYFNATTKRFEGALAATRTEPTNGLLLAADSAKVWGVVLRKTDAAVADLLLFGYASLDLTAAAGTTAAGDYYLSSVQAGSLTLDKPPLAVPVLRSDGAGNVFVSPQFVDFLDRHVHYHFRLTALPAGDTTPPAIGMPHVITGPDASLPGWLPAGHPSFNGKAPAGAQFGYNLAADPALAAAWPPLPVENVYLAWDKGDSHNHGLQGIRHTGPDPLVVINTHGIWWMSDCYDDVPWPTALDTSNLPSASDSDHDCPRYLHMAVELWFTRVQFATAVTSVTSLRSADPRLLVRCYGTGAAAASGDLELDLDLDLLVASTPSNGYSVLKGLSDNTFAYGNVQEGLYALSDNVTLTSPTQRYLVPGDTGSPLLYQGPVGIAVSLQPTLEVSPQVIHLDGVLEEFVSDIMFLGFLPGQLSSLRGVFEVPGDVTLAGMQLTLTLRVLGRTTGTLPALTVTARRVPKSTTLALLPDDTAEFTVTIDTTVATLTQANQYQDISAEPFTVAAGDLVFFSISRSDSDGYTDEVGLLKISGLLAGS